MNSTQVVAYWLAGSRQDWRVARSLFEKRHYAECLFFLHLATEKRLKATLVAKTNKQAPFVHDLVDLARRAALGLSQAQEDFLDHLTRYNIQGRYPEMQPGRRSRPGRAVCERTMTQARRFGLWLNQQGK